MADTLVERLTGQASAGQVPVEIGLIITDKALLGHEDTPADLPGHGPLPAWLACRLLCTGAPVALRRLFTDPAGHLVGMESRRRHFSTGLRRFLHTRDGHTCRTPWCDAPIRHTDHITAHRHGGPTSAGNGQGLCERCNYTKDLPGWTARATQTGPPHHVQLKTPTGHTYDSTAPPLLYGLAGTPPKAGAPPLRVDSVLERRLTLSLAA